ncbi:hypothetical protein [Vacuolonema iberomarrocanum]|uniref:hypothetical protein n=1 Tax=Vacuolonema iberomarrocanum TaxID=3454632 RepID=UPI001A0E5A80|nr:hypothetical protein [filamentous cyanobacterium LEGE 07170]
MLYLAQVVGKNPDGLAKLKLLAIEKAVHTWVPLPEESYVTTNEAIAYADNVFLKVRLSVSKQGSKQVEWMEEATDWILGFLSEYLSVGVSPAQLRDEAERAEQWRQSLTLRSQELARRDLEIEARQEQIQQLEENIQQERKKLERWAAELEKRETLPNRDLKSSTK